MSDAEIWQHTTDCLPPELLGAFLPLAPDASSGWCGNEKDMAIERVQNHSLDFLLGVLDALQFESNPSGMWFYEVKVWGLFGYSLSVLHREHCVNTRCDVFTVYWLSTFLSQYTDVQIEIQIYQTHSYTACFKKQICSLLAGDKEQINSDLS